MKSFMAGVLTVALVFTAAGVASAAEKIAVVDLEKVMKALDETKNAEELLEDQYAELKEQKEEIEKNLEAKRAELEALREAAGNKMLSEAAREAKEEEFRKKVREYQRLELEARKSLADNRKTLEETGALLSKQIVKKLRDKISSYAQEKGIDLVLDKGAVGVAGAETVLYASAKLDITDDIMKLASAKDDE